MDRMYDGMQLNRETQHPQYEPPGYYHVDEEEMRYAGAMNHAADAARQQEQLALYQQFYGNGNNPAPPPLPVKRTLPEIGLYAPHMLAKRVRVEDMHPGPALEPLRPVGPPQMPTGMPPAYPSRPGEKACAFFMKTGTCSYGAGCRFDHPAWVPAGGVPEWKDGPLPDGLPPERPGEQECTYFLKTGICKYGAKCKFSHPRHLLAKGGGEDGVGDAAMAHFMQHPPRWGEYPVLHPYGNGPTNGLAAAAAAAVSAAKMAMSAEERDGQWRVGAAYPVAPRLNTKGLPLRPEQTDCTFYMKTGSCKFGPTCKFHHPEGEAGPNGFQPYPERVGQPECAFYMKTGTCKFGPGCRFHHPRITALSTPGGPPPALKHDPTVKLTLAGLPRREGESSCSYYMKTGSCRYGASCRFDHPPPGEAVAMASALGAKVDAPQGGAEGVTKEGTEIEAVKSVTEVTEGQVDSGAMVAAMTTQAE